MGASRVSVFLPVYLFIRLSNHAYLFIHLSNYTYLSYNYTYLSIYYYTYLSIYLIFHTYLSVYLTLYLFIHLSTLFIMLFVCVSVFLLFCPPFFVVFLHHRLFNDNKKIMKKNIYLFIYLNLVWGPLPRKLKKIARHDIKVWGLYLARGTSEALENQCWT